MKPIAYSIGGLFLMAVLAGCGKVGPLEPQAGQAPPEKAYGQSEIPDSETLMTASEQARPGRSDELMRRSERRSDDPFDLPPGSEATDKKPAPLPTDTDPQPE